MTEHTISLPESIYRGLLSVAQAKGLSPAKWIALQLAPETEGPQPSTEFSENLIGATVGFAFSQSSHNPPITRK